MVPSMLSACNYGIKHQQLNNHQLLDTFCNHLSPDLKNMMNWSLRVGTWGSGDVSLLTFSSRSLQAASWHHHLANSSWDVGIQHFFMPVLSHGSILENQKNDFFFYGRK